MAEEVVGRAVLPARTPWWPRWVGRLLGQGGASRRRRRSVVADDTAILPVLDPPPQVAPTAPADTSASSTPSRCTQAVVIEDVPLYTGPVSTRVAVGVSAVDARTSPRGW